ncbi:MAG: hypothetical protein Q6351_007960 [Candidatus Njordarchaeum guaymaensis]
MNEENIEDEKKKKWKINWRNGFPFIIGFYLSFIPLWLMTSGILLRLGPISIIIFLGMIFAISAFVAYFEEDL